VLGYVLTPIGKRARALLAHDIMNHVKDAACMVQQDIILAMGRAYLVP
jgi:hypothetical protein